jgi:hypothetical protein
MSDVFIEFGIYEDLQLQKKVHPATARWTFL